LEEWVEKYQEFIAETPTVTSTDLLIKCNKWI
jgi:hypothetical protein